MSERMKTGILLLMLSVALPPFCLAGDFRAYAWGDRLATIKAKEGEPLREAENLLVYADTIAGVDFEVRYEFEEGFLNVGSYFSQTPFENGAALLAEFMLFEEIFTQKYGAPDEPHQIWFDDTYKYDSDKLADALMLGQVVLTYERELERTQVRNHAAGGGRPTFELNHRVFYRCKFDVTPVQLSDEDMGKL